MATTIYLDNEAQTILNQHRKENPHFNLSQFIKRILKEYTMESETIDIEKAQFEMNNIDTEIKRLQDKKEYIMKRIDLQQNQSTQEKELIKMLTNEYAETIFKYCEIDKKEALILAKKFIKTGRGSYDLAQFCEELKIPFRR